MRYIAFPFKLIAYLFVFTIYCMGSMRGPFPKWNNMLGSLKQGSNTVHKPDKRRKLILQVQSTGGYWGNRWETQNTPIGIQNSLKQGVALSTSEPRRARVIDKKTGAVVDMMQA